jgi:septum formation protein
VSPVRLVLASASPARRATLLAAGIEATVHVSGVDEGRAVAEAGVTDAAEVALLLARAKAQDVAAQLGAPHDALVVGCDSVLAFEGEVFGKPDDAGQARERWRRMRGSSGTLVTGHWVVDLREDGSGAGQGAVASTVVHFADPDDDELEAYLATGEPLAVAGAFTVDGLGGAFVRGIEGDHHNVVGISLPLLRELVRACGVPWHTLWR